MNAKLDYDVRSNAAYLRFSSNTILESEEISPGVVMDFDIDGKIVAIEFLNATERIPAEALASQATIQHVGKPATSAILRRIAYDRPTKTLFVTFAGGDLYAYSGVAFETYEAFKAAASKGRFFLDHIRGRFSPTVVAEEQRQTQLGFGGSSKRQAANDSFDVPPDDDATVAG